jgi:hypothetical protein
MQELLSFFSARKKKDIDRLAEQSLTALFVAARMQQST